MTTMLPQWKASGKAEHNSLFYCLNGMDFVESVPTVIDRNPQYMDLGPFRPNDWGGSGGNYTKRPEITLGTEFFWTELAVRLIVGTNSNSELAVSSWGRILIGLDWGKPRLNDIHGPTIVAAGFLGVPKPNEILDVLEYTQSGYTSNLTSQMLARPQYIWDSARPQQSGIDSYPGRFEILWDHVFQCCINGPCVHHHECIIPIDRAVKFNRWYDILGAEYAVMQPHLFVFWTGPAGLTSLKCLQGMMSIEARFNDDRERK